MKSKLLSCLTLIVLLAPLSALADIIYELSLEANGEVDAINIQLTTPEFLPVGGLNVIPLVDPSVSYTPGNDVVTLISFVGHGIDPLWTFFGVGLVDFAFEGVLFTLEYPDDYFAFDRSFDELGTFTSISGNVVSTLALDTANPIATLRVYDDTAVPAPPTLALIGLALVGFGWSRRRKA